MGKENSSVLNLIIIHLFLAYVWVQQILADVIGGYGHLGKHGYEVGYVDYILTSEGKRDPIMSELFEKQQNKPLLIMHHKDSFELPTNASILAYTSNGYIAAFRFGSAFCVQFHPEVVLADFYGWVEGIRKNRAELYEHLDIDAILHQVQACETESDKSQRLFFEIWWNSIQN